MESSSDSRWDSDYMNLTRGYNTERKLLTKKMRKFVWSICKQRKGIPGRACNITESYFFHQMIKFKKLTGARKTNFRKELIKEFPLILLTSIFLASKLTERKPPVISSSMLKLYSDKMGIQSTRQMIMQHEFKIMKTLDFKLPLWSGVDIALEIASAVSMDHLLLQVELAMDAAESNFTYINDGICEVIGTTTILSNHQLAAGVVVTVADRNMIDTDDVDSRVAKYSRIPVQYLNFLRSIISDYV